MNGKEEVLKVVHKLLIDHNVDWLAILISVNGKEEVLKVVHKLLINHNVD
jgi:hypothetical protein